MLYLSFESHSPNFLSISSLLTSRQASSQRAAEQFHFSAGGVISLFPLRLPLLTPEAQCVNERASPAFPPVLEREPNPGMHNPAFSFVPWRRPSFLESSMSSSKEANTSQSVRVKIGDEQERSSKCLHLVSVNN